MDESESFHSANEHARPPDAEDALSYALDASLLEQQQTTDNSADVEDQRPPYEEPLPDVQEGHALPEIRQLPGELTLLDPCTCTSLFEALQIAFLPMTTLVCMCEWDRRCQTYGDGLVR